MIHNPESGDDDHAGEHLVELATRAGYEVTYCRSKNGWRTGIDDNRPDLIAVAGGDGTVGAVVREIANRHVPLTILPTGTANNIAGYLGLSGIPLNELIDGWARGALQPFDVGVARGPWGTLPFLESVGVGLLAHLMTEIDAGGAGYVNELDGRTTRLNAALHVLERVVGRLKPVRCDIELDERVLSGDFLLIEVLNFGAAGPNLQLAPHADGADGRLDIALVEVLERPWLEQHVTALRTDPRNAPPLRVRHARRVTMRCQPCPLHLDDQRWEGDGEAGSIELTVDPSALTFLVPSVAKERVPEDL